MAAITNNPILVGVQLNWLDGNEGILSAKNASGTIAVAGTSCPGEEGRPWTAEHLFLGSISSGFMSTFLLFAREMKLEISGFSCDVIGQVDHVEGGYRFTQIDLYPKLYIPDESARHKAGRAMAKTHQHNLITRSISAVVFYHSEILPKKYHPGIPIEEGSYEIVY